MRVIDADALMNETSKLWAEMPDGEELCKELVKAICHAPTVDAVPVKHGRWIVDTKFGNDVLSSGKMVTCSCCGKGGRFDGGSPYCSNCGAKMDGRKVDE